MVEQQTMNMIFRMFDSTIGGTRQLVDVLAQNLRWAASVDRNARALLEHMEQGGNTDAAYCDSEHLDEVIFRLRNEGIRSVQGYLMLNGERTGIISTADVDREQVSQIINRVREEIECGGVKPRRMIERISEGRVRMIPELTVPEAMLFARYAEEAGLCIAVDEDSKQRRTVVYPVQCARQMKEMGRHVAEAFEGKAGRALRRQLMYENRNFERVSGRVLNYGRKQDEFYVMGMAGVRLLCRKKDVRAYDNDGMEIWREERGSKEFERRVRLAFDGIRHPVDLTPDEYLALANTPCGERATRLKEIDREHGRPRFTAEETRALAERKRKAEELYERKLALDNPRQTVYQYSYLNDEMGMPEFTALENANRAADDEDVREVNGYEVEIYDDIPDPLSPGDRDTQRDAFNDIGRDGQSYELEFDIDIGEVAR